MFDNIFPGKVLGCVVCMVRQAFKGKGSLSDLNVVEVELFLHSISAEVGSESAFTRYVSAVDIQCLSIVFLPYPLPTSAELKELHNTRHVITLSVLLHKTN